MPSGAVIKQPVIPMNRAGPDSRTQLVNSTGERNGKGNTVGGGGGGMNGHRVGGNKKAPKVQDDTEDDLLVLTSRISLIDCISGERIKFCVKSTKCEHLSCFDFSSFIELQNPSYVKLFDRLESSRKEIRFKCEDIITESESDGLNGAPFKIVTRKGEKFNANNRKLTLRKSFVHVGILQKELLVFKCPLCNRKFYPSELIFDDFMHVLINHPLVKDVQQVEIDDEWRVRPVGKDQKVESTEVVALSDDESDDAIITRKRKRKKSIHEKDSRAKRNGESSEEFAGFDDISNLFGDDDDSEWQDNEEEEEEEADEVNDFEVFLPNGTEDDPVVLD